VSSEFPAFHGSAMSIIATGICNVPLGVATAGRCVLVPPCAAYLSPTFFTPWVSKMLLRVVLDVDELLVVIWTPYSMGATFLADLGNRTTAAPIAPAPMAMFRGVRAGMFELGCGCGCGCC
jgi:hypothetical protein